MDGRRSLSASDSGVGESFGSDSSLLSISPGESRMGSMGDSMTEFEVGNGSSAVSYGHLVRRNATNNRIPLAPLIRITVEPVSSEDDSDADSSIFLELSETGLSDKTLAELDGIIEDSGIMVSCDEVEDSFAGDNSSEIQMDQMDEIAHPDFINDSSSLLESPCSHKSRRTDSSPSHTNLSEEGAFSASSAEEGDNGSSGGEGSGGGVGGGRRVSSSCNVVPSSEGDGPVSSSLKVEEIKPRRRNTIADIFRWYGH